MNRRKAHSDAHPGRRDRDGRDNRASGRKTARAGDRRDGTPWLYGTHAVSAALANRARHITRLLATAQAAEHLAAAGLAQRLPPEIVDRDVIEGMLPPGAVHQGLALLAVPLPDRHVTDLAVHADAMGRTVAVALDQVTDPQNIGAVLRTAAAFGAAGVIVTDRHAPEATGALAKAASGALETVPLIRPTNLVRGLDELKKAGFWTIGLDAEGAEPIDRIDLPERTILVLGAEGAGLRRLTRENCDMIAAIPMSGAMESLNVSASAAVALYEWARRGRT